jgi:hypothetical protein
VYDSTLQKLCFWTGVRWVCLDDSGGGGGSIAYDSIKQINDTTIAFQRSNFTVDTLIFTYKYPPQAFSIFSLARSAYSLRQIDETASVCIRVRRSSDNTEQDIGFNNFYLDTTALKSFVGAGDGFVTIWYDQKGYANASQATTTRQPRIVSSGNIFYQNGIPSLEFGFGAAGKRLFHASNYAQPVNSFVVTKLNNAVQALDVIYDSYSNVPAVIFNSGSAASPANRYILSSGTDLATGITVDNLQVLISGLHNGATSKFRLNGAAIVTGNSGTNTLTGLSIGDVRGNPNPVNASIYLKGSISEIIIFLGEQTGTGLADIESNINSFYAIY